MYKNIERRKKRLLEWIKSPTRPRAKCHPDKPHRARGMCDACYDKWLYANSEKHKKQRLDGAKKWRTANPKKKKECDENARLKRRYGLTIEQVEEMKKQQENKCAICGRSDLPLAVDHSHATNKVRALLCLPCNGSLGWVERLKRKENSEWMNKAIKYLEYYDAN